MHSIICNCHRLSDYCAIASRDKRLSEGVCRACGGLGKALTWMGNALDRLSIRKQAFILG